MLPRLYAAPPLFTIEAGQHFRAVFITNLVLLEAVEVGSVKAIVPDAYPLAVKVRSNATFGYIEDFNDESEEEDQPFDAKAFVGVVTEALADKEREIQM